MSACPSANRDSALCPRRKVIVRTVDTGRGQSALSRLAWTDRQRNITNSRKQRLEAVIHVLLDMAVKQGRSRLVGGKVHASAPKGGHHHRVLDDPRGGFAINLRDLESWWRLHMERMRIVGAVIETSAGSACRCLLEHATPRSWGVRLLPFTVETVEFAGAARRHFFKNHVPAFSVGAGCVGGLPKMV